MHRHIFIAFFYDKPEFIENNQYNYIFFLRLIHKTKAG